MMRNVCLVLAFLVCLPAVAQQDQEKKPAKEEIPEIFGHPEWKYPNKMEAKIVEEKIGDIPKCHSYHEGRAGAIFGAGELIKNNRKIIRQDIINWAVDELIKHFEGDYIFDVRRMCPEALTKICDKKTTADLLEHLKVEWKKIKGDEKAKEEHPWIEDPEKVKKDIKSQVQKIRKVLLKKLKEDNKNKVREQCAGFLPEIATDKEVADALTNALLNDGWSIVRAMAVNSLLRIKNPSCIPALRKALEKDSYSTVRAAAAKALTELGDKESLPLFKNGLNDGWSTVRLACIQALAKFGTKDVLKPLIGRLSDKKDIVREKAAIALGRIGDASVLPALEKAASDEYETVRESVYNALAGIGKRLKSIYESADIILADRKVDDKTFKAKLPAITEFIDLLVSEDAEEATRLSNLCRMGLADGGMTAREDTYDMVAAIGKRFKSASKQAADLLVKKGLADEILNPKMAAIQGLLHLNDERGIEALVKTLKHKYPFRQSDAVNLGLQEKVRDPRFLKGLDDLINSKKTDPHVKKEARKARDELTKPETKKKAAKAPKPLPK